MKKGTFSFLMFVLVTMICAGFVSCGDDDENGQSNNLDSRLFGTWWDGNSKEPCGFIFESNGKYSYDEWKANSQPFSSPTIGTWSTEGNYITTVRDKDKKTERFRYEFRSDGKYELYLYEQYKSGEEGLEFKLMKMN